MLPVFTTVAATIAFLVETGIRRLASAISAWLLMAVVYDALVLPAAVRFADYPLERLMLAAMRANPIDLSRLLLLQLDGAALLGCTWAVLQRFLAGAGNSRGGRRRRALGRGPGTRGRAPLRGGSALGDRAS